MKFKEAIRHAVNIFENDQTFLNKIKEEDPTMVKQLPILKKLNQQGFLTNQSQAGTRKKGKGYEIHERAFVSGFMKQGDAAEFIKKMALYTDKNAIFVPICGDTVAIPANLDIPLTISRQKGVITIVTHASTAIPQSIETMFRKDVELNKTERVVFILCWDPEWNRVASNKGGLFWNILRCLH
jgi:hypothetical protein